jgi:predicted O-linked N-acetylglucosamine transferase (SPINDLY family)
MYDWTEYPESTAGIVDAVARGGRADYPFSFLAVADDPELQLKCAQDFAASYAYRRSVMPEASRPAHNRIRVAYLSADFLEHPTAFLLAGLLEQHNRDKFEIIAISLRADPRSSYSKRVRAAVDRWVDAEHMTTLQLENLIQELEVDIAVDLMGFTGEHRSEVLARRPAPIQVNYLGYPGTMGADYIDYIIVDDYLVPATERANYHEQLVYMPECFQANDGKRPQSERMPSRADMGLPDDAFVWSSFNSSAKLNPPLFDVWCRLLQAVPDSILWIIANDAHAETNLRNEAESRGIDATRLVFARRLLYSEHLARLALADIALDTYPFNGGATTSDALWMGVPVITCSGRSMAARMSGSLLHAVNLPELIAANLVDYEQLAISLATNPEQLEALRGRLRSARTASALFDTGLFRRRIESAYIAMWERYSRNEPPTTIQSKFLLSTAESDPLP